MRPSGGGTGLLTGDEFLEVLVDKGFELSSENRRNPYEIGISGIHHLLRDQCRARQFANDR